MSLALECKRNIKIPHIAILNLMPKKIETETQFLNVFSSIPFCVYLDFIYVSTYTPKNCDMAYLQKYYKSFDEIKDKKYDGMIITGAPVELMEFEEVDYWEELKDIFDYSKRNVKSTFHICWAAQAALYYHYGIPKYTLDEKVFGVFPHKRVEDHLLFKGFDDEFLVPHSRYTEVRREDIEMVKDLQILSESDEVGVFLVGNSDGSQIFSTGHLEYDALTLKEEYQRDRMKGLNTSIPKNYFETNINEKPKVKWRAHSTLLFTNWVREYLIGGI